MSKPSISIPTELNTLLLEMDQWPADFENYRQRAQILQRLKYAPVLQILENANVEEDKRELLQKMVLDLLLAEYQQRLTVYLPLLVEPIESYAKGMRNETFWDCIKRALDYAWTALITGEENEQNTAAIQFKSSLQLTPDYATYRLQLLRLLGKLPIAAVRPEMYNQYLMSKFIRLYREEFMQLDETPTSDINAVGTIDRPCHENINEMDEEENDFHVMNDTMKSKKLNSMHFHTHRRGTLNALKAILALFSRFKNPQTVYREQEVRDIYYELLLVNEPEVQRLALSCLFTYKHSWLTLYRESLEGLLDEKRFRDQLVLFTIDASKQIVDAAGNDDNNRGVGKKSSKAIPLLEEHRTELMPVLLRLLYGSLHTHVAHRGKPKRIAIFRFLANCLPNELELFLRLLFGSLISLFEFNTSGGDIDIQRTLDLLAMKRSTVQSISLNKMKGVLGTFNDVFRHFCRILSNDQLQLLFGGLLLTAQIILLREKWLGDEVDQDSALYRQLKNLRLSFMQTIIRFFHVFKSHSFSPIVRHIHCLFNNILNTLIASKCKYITIACDESNEGRKKLLLALPASLIRLFCIWAKIRRYHPLLNVRFRIQIEHPENLPTPLNQDIETSAFALICDQLFIFHGCKDSKARSVALPEPTHVEILRVCCALLDSTNEATEDNEEFDWPSNDLMSEFLPQVKFTVTSESSSTNERHIDSLGARLVLADQHLNKILSHFSQIVVGSTKNINKQEDNQLQIKKDDEKAKTGTRIGRIPAVYFDLLSRLSAHIERSDLGTLFAHTLLSYVTNRRGQALRKQRSDRAGTLLATLTRFSAHLTEPLMAIQQLAPLFSYLDDWQLRKSLTSLVYSLHSNPRLPREAGQLLELFAALESWDPRRIAEPDAERRCEAMLQLLQNGYEAINNNQEKPREAGSVVNLLADQTIAAAFLPMFAHSHANCLMSSADLSLRATAGNCFRQLISFVSSANASSEKNTVNVLNATRFLHSHLIPLTLRGLKVNLAGTESCSKNNGIESIRHEFLQCLVELLHSFPDDPHLAPLRAIGGIETNRTDGNDVSEMDFFECAMHIQAHRKQRAFCRLAERLDNGELQIGHLPLLHYILPIVEPYLMNLSPNRSALTDQALHLFTAILRRIPWSKYQKMLEEYLHKIVNDGKYEAERHEKKATIRIITALLDAFHFDLSKCCEPELITNLVSLQTNSNHSNAKKSKQIDGNDKEKHARDEANSSEQQNDVALMPSTNSKQVIYMMVTRKLLPRLREFLNPECQHNHRRAQQFVAKSYQYEDEKLLRAPLVIAAVKLFKWLPQHVVDQNLLSFLLTLNHLLMSRSSSVRHGARKLMVRLVRLLGAKQLPLVVRELKQTMKKGFQVHVMVFTVHTLINSLENDIQPGDIDPCLRELIEVCKWETFGNSQLEQDERVADSSESHGVPEARNSNKTLETLNQIGRFVGNEHVLEETVLAQMHEIIESSPKAETVRKLSDWLRALSVGMRYNAGGIPPLRQLKFALQLAQKTLQKMIQDQIRLTSKLNDANLNGSGRGLRPQSCLLLLPEPKRLGVIQKVAVKSKVHIFMEFALQLLADQLKAHFAGEHGHAVTTAFAALEQQETMDIESEPLEEDNTILEPENAISLVNSQVTNNNEIPEVLALFEQFASLLVDTLKQKYDKIIAIALRSLLYLLKYPLKSLKERQSELVECLFIILADYSAIGQVGNRPVIIELQQHLFKCFTHVIRHVPLSVFNVDRMQLLLNYVETDILDTHKQATAFSLIKAIIGRKIDDEKLDNVIEYLSEMAITSFSPNIRIQCRQVLLLYLTTHPKGQHDYEKWMEFFLNQTEYELEDGRVSALEMIHSMLNALTEEANSRYALLIHLKLSALLLNDESARCRQQVAACIRKLLCSITPAIFNDVHAATNDWLKARKSSIRLLALRTFIQFVQSGTQHFSGGLLKCLLQSVITTFTCSSQEFADEILNAIKLALCELLHSIAEKAPDQLNELILNNETNKKAEKRKRRHASAKEKKQQLMIECDSEEHGAEQKFLHFIENLQHCILPKNCHHEHSQQNQSDDQQKPNHASQLQLSIMASQFLNQWLEHSPSRAAFIKCLLHTRKDEKRQSSKIGGTELLDSATPKSLLYSLCQCLVDQLDVPLTRNVNKQKKQKKAAQQSQHHQFATTKNPQMFEADEQQEAEDEEEEEENDEHDEMKEENDEHEEEEEETTSETKDVNEGNKSSVDDAANDDASSWDDTLAELTIRSLAHLAPSLDSKHFELVCRRLAKICWSEVAKEPDRAQKRFCIFKLVAVFALKFHAQSIEFDCLCTRILPLLYREMCKKSAKFTEQLYALATEVSDQFRKQLGHREFSARLALCQKRTSERKEKRKRKAMTEVITRPAAAIAAKQKRHLRKREARKRKLDALKPYRAFKRRRREEAIQRAAATTTMLT